MTDNREQIAMYREQSEKSCRFDLKFSDSERF
jgi:hypothetical protein